LPLVFGALEALGPRLLEADVDPAALDDSNGVLGVFVGNEVDVDVTMIVVPSCDLVRMTVVILLEGAPVVVVRVVGVVVGVAVVGVVVVGEVVVAVVVGVGVEVSLVVVMLVVGSGPFVDVSKIVGVEVVPERTVSGSAQDHWSWGRVKDVWNRVEHIPVVLELDIFAMPIEQ
jgi:hypothetical protein